MFTVRFVRQLATDGPDSHTSLTCCLEFPHSDDLAALGAFDSSWPACPGAGTLDAWFDAVGARPEWALFDSITPRSIDFARQADEADDQAS